MKLTKHEHACVVAEKDGTSIVIDPGSFSPGAAEIIAGGDVILITHEHADHVHEEAINRALADRPDLKLYAPEALRRLFAAARTSSTPSLPVTNSSSARSTSPCTAASTR